MSRSARPCRLARECIGLKVMRPNVQHLIWPCSTTFALENRRCKSTETNPTSAVRGRWLSDVKKRIGHCITFGLTSSQTHEAGQILQEIARDWRELVAGSEGFLTDRTRRSMYRHLVVWGEMDQMAHVNNVMYNRYSESGRIGWLQKIATFVDPAHRREWIELVAPKGIGVILRTITTEFKFPMTWPDHISVYHKLQREPKADTDAFVLDVVIMSELHQRVAARCTEDIVVYDYRIGKKAPLEPYMLDVFRETWQLQETAKRENSAKVKALSDKVRALEKASWDRPDAVEDMGRSTK